LTAHRVGLPQTHRLPSERAETDSGVDAAGREDQRAVGELGFGAGGRASFAGSAAGDAQVGGRDQLALVVGDEQVVLVCG